MVQKLKIGVSGLGRMGKRHAINFLTRTPRAELVAAFTPDQTELQWAQAELAPYGTRLYTDYDEMLRHEGLQAVCIATITAVHAEQAMKAMDANLHVLCEKPLSIDVEICRQVIQKAKSKPRLKVMCGFSRRFDASYRDAYEKVEQGVIGRPLVFRSQTCDKNDPSPFFYEYSRTSGGNFVDMSVHDIDLCLWFMGRDLQVKSVAAIGITGKMPALAKHKDYDNGVAIVEFYGGKMAYFFTSRIMAHGQEDVTEIIGADGKLVVNGNPQANLVNAYTPAGIVREAPAHYYGRFEYAFVAEANEFTAACLDGNNLPLKFEDAGRVLEIASYLQEAVRTGRKLNFDEVGNRIEAAKL